jgi:hypothetical protein
MITSLSFEEADFAKWPNSPPGRPQLVQRTH